MKERLNREIYDLGPGYYAARINPERRKRSHIRQLESPRLHRHPAALCLSS